MVIFDLPDDDLEVIPNLSSFISDLVRTEDDEPGSIVDFTFVKSSDENGLTITVLGTGQVINVTWTTVVINEDDDDWEEWMADAEPAARRYVLSQSI